MAAVPVSPVHSANGRKQRKSPWRMNPSCTTTRAIAIFRAYTLDPTAWRKQRLAELEIDNTNPPPEHPDSDQYQGP